MVALSLFPGHPTLLISRFWSPYDYSIFVEKVRKYRYDMNVRDAIDKAVDECINDNIMADILSEMKSEVRDMLIYEFDEKVYEDGLREEGELLSIIDVIIRRASKGVPLSDIACGLDMTIDETQPIYDEIITNPGKSKNEIYQILYCRNHM